MKLNDEPVYQSPITEVIADDLEVMLSCLPREILQHLTQQGDVGDLIEVVLDLGRFPQARFPVREIYLGETPVTGKDIESVTSKIGRFGDDNRAGIEKTLHRISAMRNRLGDIVGLTCRVGRAVSGTAQVIDDLMFSGKNILLLGRPGVGKTTILRETARVLADEASKRVVIVDTSNEIAGDGDVPHPAIGKARRMQVSTPSQQHSVMIEAVENHMPEVIIIDEMGTEQDARAARTIAERGVQLIATAHGDTLENLLINPTLSDLVGGVETVTLSDEEARRRRTQKAILERRSPPTFDALVEIRTWDRVAIHQDVAATVDRILRGQPVSPSMRSLDTPIGRDSNSRHAVGFSGASRTQFVSGISRKRVIEHRESESFLEPQPGIEIPATAIFCVGVEGNLILEVAEDSGIPVVLVNSVADANMVLTTRAYFQKSPKGLEDAERLEKPVFVLRNSSSRSIHDLLMKALYQLKEDKGHGTLKKSSHSSTVDGPLIRNHGAFSSDQDVIGSKKSVYGDSDYVRDIQNQITSSRLDSPRSVRSNRSSSEKRERQ